MRAERNRAAGARCALGRIAGLVALTAHVALAPAAFAQAQPEPTAPPKQTAQPERAPLSGQADTSGAAPSPAPPSPASPPAAPVAAPPEADPADARVPSAPEPSDAASDAAEPDPENGAITLDSELEAELAEGASSASLVPSPDRIVYVLERIEIVGNSTSADVIRSFLPIQPGELLDVDDPDIDRVRFRLLGTGWFNDVRLHLKRGSERGRVVLVIEVEERNTLIVSRVVAGLARVVTSSTDRDDDLRPYAGLGLTETNLFGLGIGVGLSGVVSEHQAGVDLRYRDPVHLGDGFELRGRLFYNDAREFFGREPLVWGNAPCPEPIEGEPDPDCNQTVRRAVVIYERGGFGLGTGRDLSRNLRYEIEWLGEIVGVSSMPAGASTLRGKHGEERAPIDFHIEDGRSYVSSLQLGLIFDTRDDPVSPARGQLLRLDGRLGAGLFGSSYDFVRVELTFKQYARLPWGHVLVPGVYVGSVFGDAPFFYQFYAADLSDLLPSRVLELNLDHRRTHNLLDTSIQEFDKEELAVRFDLEYQLPLHRGGGAVRGIDAYAGAGLFLLAERDAIKIGLPGYSGFERVPVDLTFDVGVQADTSLGLFKVGFSSLIGFLPDLGQSQ